MRLRNIPRAESVLANSEMVIKDERHFRGKWNSEIFHNNHPLHIEVGMGKGQFILTLAEQNPDINYIGIERYSSVLLRAVEKLEVTSDSSSEETVTLHLPNLRFICMDATDLPEVFAENEESVRPSRTRSSAYCGSVKRPTVMTGIVTARLISVTRSAEKPPWTAVGAHIYSSRICTDRDT